jgi:hypothetical protein
MNTSSMIGTFLLLVFVGCSSKSPTTPGSGVQSDPSGAGSTAGSGAQLDTTETGSSSPLEPLSTCIIGWWSGGSVSCSPQTVPDGGTQLKASDCMSSSFVGYGADGALTSGFYEYSPSLGTMSGSFLRAKYSLTANGVDFLPRKQVSQVTSCSATQLQFTPQIETRIPPNIAAALVTATAGGGSSLSFFVNVSVAPGS